MGGSLVEDPLYPPTDDLKLIETALWDGSACALAAGHLARLDMGARRLGWDCDPAAARAALRGHTAQPARLRLLLDRHGAITVEQSAVPAPIDCWRLGLAGQRLHSDDMWLGVKSTHRPAYDAARASIPADLHEVILLNQRGEVCDGTITTLFFDRGDGLRTPPQTAGLLPGVLRAAMLADGRCQEERLMPQDLPGLRLWVGNALRGLCPAVWVAS